MLEEDNYSSDTSDEDFIPEGVALDDDHSESGDEGDESEEEEEAESQKGKKRKPNIKFKGNKKIRKKKKLESEDIAPEVNKETNCVEEAKKADSLWADFLADVDEKPAEVEKPKPKNSWASLLNPNKKHSSSDSTKGDAMPAFSKPKERSTVKDMPPDKSKVKITKVFEFAGEEVRVEEEVAADSLEAKLSKQIQNEGENGKSSDSDVKKKPGLASVLNLIDNKKRKLSTLEKTKIDWVNFKSSEGLDDEMQTHLKSKEGYLEKQAFLERADLRQFEIERSMRMSRRSNR